MEIKIGDNVCFSAWNFNEEDPDNPTLIKIPGVVTHIEQGLATIHTDKRYNGSDFIVKRTADLTKK